MPSISVFDFLRKARRFLFNGEESLDLEASPAAPGSSAKGGEQAQDGSATPGLACMGMIRCKSVAKQKLARASSLTKPVKMQSSERKPALRMTGVMGGRSKVQAFPEAEDMAAPRRSAAAKAPIGAITMNVAAGPPRRKTNGLSLWERRTKAEPPLLQIGRR